MKKPLLLAVLECPSKRNIPKRFLFKKNRGPVLEATATREITASGERSHHRLLLALSSENTLIQACILVGSLGASEGKDSQPPPQTASVFPHSLGRCAATLFSVPSLRRKLSEQADVMPKLDGSSSTSKGEFPLQGSRRGRIWQEHWRGSRTTGFLFWGPWPSN